MNHTRLNKEHKPTEGIKTFLKAIGNNVYSTEQRPHLHSLGTENVYIGKDRLPFGLYIL